MASTSWSPDPAGLQELLACFKQAETGDSATQRAVLQRMESFTAIPDYSNYLAYIFTQLPSEPESVRWKAGLTLKNNIRTGLSSYSPQVISYLKDVIFIALADPAHFIRTTAASVLDWLYRGVGPDHWPEALDRLLQMAESDNRFAQEGATKALSNICQEIPRYLGSMEVNGHRPFDVVLPKVVNLLSSSNDKVRIDALTICNQFIEPPTPPNGLALCDDAFLAQIFKLASDSNTEIRKLICQSFNALLAAWAPKLWPNLKSIIDFMLYSTQDDDEGVALQAAEFWLTFLEEPDLPEHLKPYMDSVMPVLLKGMIYTDFAQAVLDQDNEDESKPDKDSDIKPKHYGSKAHTAERVGNANGDVKENSKTGLTTSVAGQEEEDDEDDDEDDDDDDEDDPYAEWTVRKCCAAALDMMATTFEVDILPIILPYLQKELESSEWKEREAGILALGAIAEGCISGMEPHLPSLVPFLFDSLKHEKPLVRSIACWTLGRYSAWCIPQGDDEQHKQRFFEPTIQGLLATTCDHNKRVQEAGCSAFATLEEIAGQALEPYLPIILPTLVDAFGRYQQKNLLILYDAIGTLADAVGVALNREEYIGVLMPPLIAKWQTVDDLDADIIPLLECLSSVVVGLGHGFLPYAPPVFHRCVHIVRSCLMLYEAFMTNPNNEVEEPDRTHLIVALDLLSGLTQALSEDIQPFFAASDPPMIDLMIACFKYPEPPVQQSSFALLGDTAISCFSILQPRLAEVMPLVIEAITPEVRNEHISVCNNAAWCAGEVALKQGAAMSEYVGPLMERLIPLLLNARIVRSLTENAAVTIGRLALVCPQIVAPHLGVFMKPWCDALAEIKDNEEKDSAFQGICLAIQANPAGVAEHFGAFLNALVRWREPSPKLTEMFTSILHGLRDMSGVEQWNAQMAQLPPNISSRLREIYRV